MSSDPADDPLDWLNDDLVARLAAGTPLVILGASGLFDGNNFKSDTHRQRFKDLRLRINDIRITGIGRFRDIEVARETKRLQGFVDDVAKGAPRVLFVEDTLAELRGLSIGPLDGGEAIDRMLLADQLINVIMTDAIRVDVSTSERPASSSDLPPLTPIEGSLREAMLKRGLDVRCQVGFEPYVVDFVVGPEGNRVIVEADGAEFHDAEADRIRDERNLERHGLRTIRFSGSSIHADAMSCAAQVERALGSKSIQRTVKHFIHNQ